MATTSTTTLTLFLGFLAITSTLLSFNTEARPEPTDEDFGTVIGPHTNLEDDLGTIVGPHANLEDDLGTIVGPHTNLNDESETIVGPQPNIEPNIKIDRSDFPEDFIFGTSVSAYQVEGAKKGSGRGLTTWDEFTHMFPNKVENGEDGDLGVDFYTHYKDDIKLMKKLKTNGFRFSISWTRILPHGKYTGPDSVNEEGVQFYNDLIDALLANGIEPAVTLFHWESPLALEMEYGGFLSKNMVKDFREFAKLCFERFGDRVKNWATFNEPTVYSVAGYSKGKKAPGRCSVWEKPKCPIGDSSKEPYIVGHNQILAHLAAVDEFRNCKKCQNGGGKIGIVLVSHWYGPQNPGSDKDEEAAKRSLEYQLGWFLRPLIHGDYPTEMRNDISSDRLPHFTAEESEKLRKSLDFVGLNYYGAFFATPLTSVNRTESAYKNDLAVGWKGKQNGSPHLKTTAKGIVIYPQGLGYLLKHIKDEYKNPEIYIMENGMDELDNGTKSLAASKNDTGRMEFIKSHILVMGKSIKIDKVRVKGYFVWSLMDNFEWEDGYKSRYGLYYVDFNNKMTRHMRASGEWFSKFLNYQTAALRDCYFDSFREKGVPPEKLSEDEYLEPNNWRIQHISNFM